ncbi:hypothetical protein TWF481_010942 [Arthrobotrys musiformis]|uniref:F-box domain-containing protein n=1 Tax=Arthrobotrys musiformis TaxID=47236 RepID=A0AAV9VZT5_9PEZI
MKGPPALVWRTRPSFLTLPYDIHIEIASYLPFVDLAHLFLSCKSLFEELTDAKSQHAPHRRLYFRALMNLDPAPLPPLGPEFKEYTPLLTNLTQPPPVTFNPKIDYYIICKRLYVGYDLKVACRKCRAELSKARRSGGAEGMYNRWMLRAGPHGICARCFLAIYEDAMREEYPIKAAEERHTPFGWWKALKRRYDSLRGIVQITPPPPKDPASTHTVKSRTGWVLDNPIAETCSFEEYMEDHYLNFLFGLGPLTVPMLKLINEDMALIMYF